MANNRSHANELIRLLTAVPQPVYALDEDLAIIFLNSACKEWLGPAAESVIGLRATYHSPTDATSPEAVAAALCPPPGTIPGIISAGVVTLSFSLPSGVGTCDKHRSARFIPLGTPEKPHGFLVVLETEDCLGVPEKCPSVPSEEPGREELHAAIRHFRQEAAGRCSAEHLVGVSPAMQLARRQVEAAGASGCSVCISGPTGSGRERLAAAIHYASNPEDVKLPFSQSGMIALDCSVLPAELIRSTLMALARPQPRENEPRGGSPRLDVLKVAPTTLVLNHVDELSDEVQAELAAMFTKRPFPRRLISTSVLPLPELVQRGKFRPDLAAVMGTIGIDLPALKDRGEDLPLLAQIFLEECNHQGSKQVGGFAPETLDKLVAYAWPGNLNELVEVVAATHKNAQGVEIKPNELPQQIHLAAQAAARPRKVEEAIHLDEFLQRVERELIRRAIARAKGNKTKAARLLGLTRPRLYRRMVQLGLEEA